MVYWTPSTPWFTVVHTWVDGVSDPDICCQLAVIGRGGGVGQVRGWGQHDHSGQHDHHGQYEHHSHHDHHIQYDYHEEKVIFVIVNWVPHRL